MPSRRAFFGIAAAGAKLLHAQSDARITREVFLRSPVPGSALMSAAWYTAKSGGEMLSVETRYSRSDTVDSAYYRRSTDHGRTWGTPVERKTSQKRPAGMWRLHPRTAVVEPSTGSFIELSVQGILPTDDPLEGMRRWNVFYRVDGVDRQAIQHAPGFDAAHPFPGVYDGRSMVMLGDVASIPLVLADGTILVPAVTTPLDAAGKPYNPTGGYTYTDALVLRAKWRNGGLEWFASQPVAGDPARATRGMDEPTLAQLPDGRVMMVMRGSNDRNPSLPAHKWISFSSDQGGHWTKPVPWTYRDGTGFLSPSACSQLVPHSSGRLYWIGHISDTNPRGNSPRYPIYLGEVDRENGLLVRESLLRIDDRQPGEDKILMLYGICAHEDRRDGRIALHMSRLFAFPDAWQGDALVYRIEI